MSDEKESDFGCGSEHLDFPISAAKSTDFVATEPLQIYQDVIVSSNGKDRLRKIDTLCMKFGATQPSVDVSQYIVLLTSQINSKYVIATGTIINIRDNTLYILTCAHGLVTFHRDELETVQSNTAEHVWCKFQNKQYHCNEYHIFPQYQLNAEVGNDIAIIECTIHSPFMFYHTFPKLQKAQLPSFIWKDIYEDDPVGGAIGSVVSAINGAFAGAALAGPLGAVFGAVSALTGNRIQKKVKYKMSIYGCPADKNKELWGMEEDGVILDERRMLAYAIDTTGGQSGSPIFIDNRIVGVHTNGDILGVDTNYGVRIGDEVLRWLYEKGIYANELEEYKPKAAE